MRVSVEAVRTAEQWDACRWIRMAVFVDEQGVPAEEEMDAIDDRASHYLLQADGVRVGTARWYEYAPGVAKIGRVAVLSDHRGRGLGRAIMTRVMDEALATHRTLVLDAQLTAIAFYERLGFAAEGGVFLDGGIEHRRMFLRR